MPTLKDQILTLVRATPGLTDREIADRLLGPGAPQQGVNQAARALMLAGELVRADREDGKIGNYLGGQGRRATPMAAKIPEELASDSLSEDDVKRKLKSWLETNKWSVNVVWGRGRGTDIEAVRDNLRWVIEAKGRGSLDPMRVNYFVAILGEILQRMTDPSVQYSIALPDIPQFRGLWARLPQLAKSRTKVSALFVKDSGDVEEVP